MSPCSTTFIMPGLSLNLGFSITTRSGHTAVWGISPRMNIGNNWSRLPSPDMMNLPKRFVVQERGEGHTQIGPPVYAQIEEIVVMATKRQENLLDVPIAVSAYNEDTSSVEYAGALFLPESDLALAQGHLTHVWVDRSSRKPVPIPDGIRAAMQAIIASSPSHL